MGRAQGEDCWWLDQGELGEEQAWQGRPWARGTSQKAWACGTRLWQQPGKRSVPRASWQSTARALRGRPSMPEPGQSSGRSEADSPEALARKVVKNLTVQSLKDNIGAAMLEAL